MTTKRNIFSCAGCFGIVRVLTLVFGITGSLTALSEDTIPSQWHEEGKRHFEKGEQLYAEEKYDTAIGEFKRAYDLLEGYESRYVILFKIGKCHEKLSRFESAANAFRQYLNDADPEAPDRAAVEKALRRLEARADLVMDKYAEARRHVLQGELLYSEENYNAAIAEFEKAYEQLKGHPLRASVLFNVGRCHERLFRYDLAHKYYRRYLDEAGEDAEDRSVLEDTLAGLEKLLCKLVIDSNVEAEVWIGDRMLGVSPGTVYVPGGVHMVELRAEGHESVRREIQITTRETRQLYFELDEIREYKGIHQGVLWTGAVLTVAALGTGVVLGSVAVSKDAEGDEQPAILNQENLAEEIGRLSLAADIMYGVSALFATFTLVFFFLTDWDSEQEEPGERKASLVPLVSGENFGLMFRGRF